MEPLNLQSSPETTFDAADLWLASLSASGRSPQTLTIYSYAVSQLRAWRSDTPHGGSDLETLTRIEAMAFTRHLLDRYKANGVRSRVKSLRAFYGWCMAEELADSNPFARVRVTVPDEAQPVLSDEALEKMLVSAKKRPRDLAVITLFAEAGCRKNELARVEMADVDLRGGTIHFRISKSRARSVPLTDRAVINTGRWLRRRGVGSGGLWNSSDPYSMMVAITKRHSGGTVTPHQLRRRFAVNFLSKGGSESSLMRLCGWSSSEMVRLYTKASADMLAHAEMRKLMG